MAILPAYSSCFCYYNLSDDLASARLGSQGTAEAVVQAPGSGNEASDAIDFEARSNAE